MEYWCLWSMIKRGIYSKGLNHRDYSTRLNLHCFSLLSPRYFIWEVLGDTKEWCGRGQWFLSKLLLEVGLSNCEMLQAASTRNLRGEQDCKMSWNSTWQWGTVPYSGFLTCQSSGGDWVMDTESLISKRKHPNSSQPGHKRMCTATVLNTGWLMLWASTAWLQGAC